MSVAKLFGYSSHKSISNWIRALKTIGVLKLAEAAIPKARAARYFYLGKLKPYPCAVRRYSSLNSANVIDSSKIKADFEQTGGSCVLASYAIAHNYFTSMPIRVCFEDYCRHFKLPFSDAKEAEQKYAEHFDLEWKKRENFSPNSFALDTSQGVSCEYPGREI
jgi:hypothetical protein